MPLTPEARHQRARVAALKRWQPSHPDVAASKVTVAEAYIRALVDDFPPLTTAQCNKLAVLLLQGGGRDASP